jgi:hypothetical protein
MIYKEDLESVGKCSCGCDAEETWMHSKCHPQSPTWVKLAGDVLSIFCSTCNEFIADFAVRSRKEN